MDCLNLLVEIESILYNCAPGKSAPDNSAGIMLNKSRSDLIETFRAWAYLLAWRTL